MAQQHSLQKGKGTAGSMDKQDDVRHANISAAKAVADAVRTSLGPRGMDKMILQAKGDVIITNDGATILQKLQVSHSCAKMLVELSRAQDVEAGDGTTSVVVLCGALLKAAEGLLHKGVHPSQVQKSFSLGGQLAAQVLEDMSIKVDIADRETIIKAAVTSLSSKVVSQNSGLLAPMAVDAVRAVMKGESVDLNDVRVVSSLGGTTDDTEIITKGTIFKQKASQSAGGPTKIPNAKIALIQFQLSAPKTDVEMQVAIKDYQQIDRAIKQERQYILQLCKKIKDAGCTVLLIQKSILRDAVSDQSLDFLAKMKIMVIKDIERTDVEFITKTIGCHPIAHIDSFRPEKFGHADLVQQESTPDGKIVRVTGVKAPADSAKSLLAPTVTVHVRGSNSLIVGEAERSFHDALCVVRSLVKRRAYVAGGGAPEIELTLKLAKKAREMQGMDAYCLKAYAEAFEIIPYTLAENAGLNPIRTVTSLRNRHSEGGDAGRNHGINVRKGQVSDMLEENVVVPLLVPSSAVKLATETVGMILKIDDIVMTR
eukprot:TRINITY_DN20809_c0_g1_i1.p1 TRINITY_DN20809_c0_g1~~TRINITY_DN20809_c0_g1_i1.p1  ORF type:complete len:571 (+),score=241.94 TRINITY_DN20809_c0_g1_i1:95-1714(+)